MKIPLSLILILSSVSLMALSAETYPDGETFDADIKIEKRCVDLGELSRSDESRCFSFIGVNTGNAPLVLTYVHPSCNCVKLLYPREPIAPGDTLRIRGRLNTHGLSTGSFRRDIIVRSNATESKIRLLVTGTILPDSITSY